MYGDDLSKHMHYRQGGSAASEATERFFEGLGLPIPESGEFSTVGNGNNLIFLNDPACVIRISHPSRARLIHPHVLQPLGKHVDALRFDIDPGEPCPIAADDKERLVRTLQSDKIQCWDPFEYNGVYLPGTADEEGKPYTCAIDYDSQSGIQSPEWLQREFPQKKIHGYLMEAFSRAWPAGQAKPDAGLMKDFWRACRQAKKEGLLVPSWLNNDVARLNYKNACLGSQRYNMHCENSGFSGIPRP